MKCSGIVFSSVLIFSSLCSSVQAAEGSVEKKTPEIRHGTSELPPSRQYHCYIQKDYGNGSDGIENAACKKAYEEAGSENWQRERLFNFWSAYSQNLENSQSPSKPKDLVPDGQLCSAGIADFDSINIISDAWYTTDLEVKEGRIKLRYIASQMHDPSTFRVFLTDQNNLKWDSLKESPEVKVEEVPSKNKLDPGHYYLDVKLPDDYSSGTKSILYIMWKRDERPHETFFSCSDVIIKDL